MQKMSLTPCNTYINDTDIFTENNYLKKIFNFLFLKKYEAHIGCYYYMLII